MQNSNVSSPHEFVLGSPQIVPGHIEDASFFRWVFDAGSRSH